MRYSQGVQKCTPFVFSPHDRKWNRTIIIIEFYKFYTNPCRLFGFAELVKGINSTTTNRKDNIMQRTYRERKYTCGDYIEVAIYPVYTQERGRGKRKKPTTEIQKRLNHRHATDRLRRLLHTNFNEKDLFVTLTFEDDRLPETVADCQRAVQNFLRRVKRKYANAGLEPKYIYIIEYGEEHQRLHAHLVISEGLGRDELTALWGQGIQIEV